MIRHVRDKFLRPESGCYMSQPPHSGTPTPGNNKVAQRGQRLDNLLFILGGDKRDERSLSSAFTRGDRCENPANKNRTSEIETMRVMLMLTMPAYPGTNVTKRRPLLSFVSRFTALSNLTVSNPLL